MKLQWRMSAYSREKPIFRFLRKQTFLSKSQDCPKQTKKDLKTNQLRFITFCSANFGCRTFWNFYLV